MEALDVASLSCYNQHPLDPLIKTLANFRSLADLKHSIALIYATLDHDNSGVRMLATERVREDERAREFEV
jgi:hypothetical protein